MWTWENIIMAAIWFGAPPLAIAHLIYLTRVGQNTDLAAVVERQKVQIRDAYRSGYHAGHHDTVEGGFAWCRQGSTEQADEWFEKEFGEPCPEPWGWESAEDRLDQSSADPRE